MMPADGKQGADAPAESTGDRLETIAAYLVDRARAEGLDLPPGDTFQAARTLVDAARGAGPAFEATAIDRQWFKVPIAMLETAPKPRPWVLRHPTRDGTPCARSEGDGFLPRGKVAFLVSAGGVGKTQVLLGLAIAIATGRNWLGHFAVDPFAQRGRVLIALAEEDRSEIHRRLYEQGQQLGLTEAERHLVASQVDAVGLAGCPVALVESSGGNLVESRELRALRSRCQTEAGPNGWSAVILDPLARWAGPDVETDNAAATRVVQALETLCDLPGGPSIMVAHHSSKAARTAGKVDSRGVTGISDAARWQATLRTEGMDVFFGLAKSNYSRPMLDEIRLIRSPGGALRAASEVEQADYASRKAAEGNAINAAKDSHKEDRIARAMSAILEGLRAARVPVNSKGALASMAGGRRTDAFDAVNRLMNGGFIMQSGRKPDCNYTLVEPCEKL